MLSNFDGLVQGLVSGMADGLCLTVGVAELVVIGYSGFCLANDFGVFLAVTAAAVSVMVQFLWTAIETEGQGIVWNRGLLLEHFTRATTRILIPMVIAAVVKLAIPRRLQMAVNGQSIADKSRPEKK